MPRKLMLILAEAAKLYGKSKSHLRLLVRTGVLSGRKFGRDWILTETDETMRAKLAARHGPGAPRKAKVPE